MKAVALLGLCSMLLCACSVYSDRPLSEPGTSTADVRLVGSWRGTVDGEEIWLHVSSRGSSGRFENWMQVVAVGRDRSGFVSAGTYHLFPTEIKGHSYANVFIDDTPSAAGGYILVAYELEGDDVAVVKPLDLAGVSAAIRRGELEGQIRGSPLVTQQARITSDSKALAAFVNSDAQIFGHPIRLTRVQAAEPAPATSSLR